MVVDTAKIASKNVNELPFKPIDTYAATSRGGATPQLAWALAQAQLQLSL